jgi:hypothetical protein
VTYGVTMRVRNRPGVLREVLRLKISCTCSGRPRSRFSYRVLEKQATVLRLVEYLGQRELGL